MTDFATARLNMVESQIRPNKVNDPRLLEILEILPRERFVPQDRQAFAYVDEDLKIGQDRYLMEPMVLSRLLQAVAPEPGDMALDIACGSAYSTAVLARLAQTVVALECESELAARGNEILNELGIDNAVVVEGGLTEGYPKQAPYDVILIGGAVQVIPQEIIDQLAEGGRLATVVLDDAGLGRATLIQRSGDVIARRVLFDANVKPLTGFQKSAEFVF